MKIARNKFLANSMKALETVYDTLIICEAIALESLAPDKTAVIAVDMINGFAKEGALYSPRVEALIPAVARLSQACAKRGILQLAFADSHPAESPEFQSYPPHCLTGTEESELVGELKAAGPFTLIRKNSTNGFLEPEFQKWLTDHEQVDTFLIVGDCTDICIEQLAITLKCSFNRINRPSRVIVPTDLVDTFDYGVHNGDLMHAVSLMMMQGSGVEVVRRISHE